MPEVDCVPVDHLDGGSRSHSPSQAISIRTPIRFPRGTHRGYLTAPPSPQYLTGAELVATSGLIAARASDLHRLAGRRPRRVTVGVRVRFRCGSADIQNALASLIPNGLACKIMCGNA